MYRDSRTRRARRARVSCPPPPPLLPRLSQNRPNQDFSKHKLYDPNSCCLSPSMITLVGPRFAHSAGQRFLSMKSLCVINFLIRLAPSCAKWIKNGQIPIFQPQSSMSNTDLIHLKIFLYLENWISRIMFIITIIRLIH